jgi:hypothetical protein
LKIVKDNEGMINMIIISNIKVHIGKGILEADQDETIKAIKEFLWKEYKTTAKIVRR